MAPTDTTEHGDPFDPVSPGLHRTDGGTRYAIGDTNPANFDFLLGRALDVVGHFFVYATDDRRMGWPGILVELNLQAREIANPTGMLDDGADPQWGDDHVPPALAARGLTAVTGWEEPPAPERVRWAVRMRDTARRPAGVYGPGVRGTPGAWALISPLPESRPELWNALLHHTGGQCGVYVTTNTAGITAITDPGVWVAAMRAEADAGRLYGARAAVIA